MAFNSNEYAWRDMKFVIAGRPVAGVTELRYELNRTMTDIYAAGDEPHTRTKGNKQYSGTLGVLQSEFEALQEAIEAEGGEDLSDLTMDIICSYAPAIGERIKTDRLENVDMPRFEKGMQQDDSHGPISFEIMIGKIYYNV